MGGIQYIQSIFTKGMERRSFLFLSMAGWLCMAVIVAKMFLGCSIDRRQAAMPFEAQFYKITNGVETVKKITLPSGLDGALSFLKGRIYTDDSNTVHFDESIYDVSKIAGIGASASTPSVKKVRKTAPLCRSTLFQPIISRAAAQYQVDPALVRAIIFAESGYNPSAVSNKGAMGLMQLMPGTAKAMGVEDCFDPEHNIYGGVKYFRKLFNQFDGDVKLALAAYNAGSRKVREFNGVPPYRATRHYIQKVMRYYDIYRNQQLEPLGLS
jgi:membrane-bound lytic murein transglycosylase B